MKQDIVDMKIDGAGWMDETVEPSEKSLYLVLSTLSTSSCFILFIYPILSCFIRFLRFYRQK